MTKLTEPAEMKMWIDKETGEYRFLIKPGHANDTCPEITQLEDGRYHIDGHGIATVYGDKGFVVEAGGKPS
jgi:hypothetical protein